MRQGAWRSRFSYSNRPGRMRRCGASNGVSATNSFVLKTVKLQTSAAGRMRPFFYIYDRNEDTLAVAEAEACVLADGEVVGHGVVEGKARIACAETGFMRAGAELLARGRTLEKLVGCIRERGLSADRYRIVAEPIPRTVGGDHRAIRAVAACIEGPADLRNPTEEFLLVVSSGGFWFGRLIPKGCDRWREFDRRPRPFCNAAPLRLVRAAIGLSTQPGDRVHDPCCGSGTIPFLAWTMGRRAYGTDRSWPAVAMARENLAHFGCPVTIGHADARATDYQSDCIITNPPYDLYCPTNESTVPGMLASFRSAAPRVTVITAMDLAPLVTELGYTVERAIPVRRHDFERTLYIMRSPE